MSVSADKAPPAESAGECRRLRAENRKLARVGEVLLAVQAAGAAVASQSDPAQALQEIATKALGAADADAAFILLAAADREHLECRAAAGEISPDIVHASPLLPIAPSGLKALGESGGVVISGNSAETHADLGCPAAIGLDSKSLVVVPLIARGSVIGVLIATRKRRRRVFREADRQVLRLFAEQAALAADNSRLYARAMDWSAQMRGQSQPWKDILDGIRDPIMLLDRSDRVAFANNAVFAALGREPEDVLGRVWEELFPPEEVAAIRASQAAGKGGIHNCEVTIVRPDGSRKPLLLRYGHGRDPAGCFLGTIAMGVDIGERDRIEGTLRRRGSMLATIGRMARAVGRGADAKQLAGRALSYALSLLGLETGVVYLVEGGDFVLTAARGVGTEHIARGGRIAVEGSVSAQILKRGKPLICRDLRRTRRLDPALRAVLPDRLRSAIIVPVAERDTPIGVMVVGGPDATPFTREAVGTLKILAALLGAGAANMRLYQAARLRAERLAVLSHAAQQLASCSSVEETIAIMCRAMARVLRARRVLGLEYRRREDLLAPVGAYGLAEARWRRLPLASLGNAPLLSSALSERQAVHSAEVAGADGLPADYCRILGSPCAIAVPIITRRGRWGVCLAQDRERPTAQTRDDIDMAMALANQVGITLDNVFLLREAQRRSEQLSLAVQEAHHRIKNNLQAVCDVLELELLERGGAASAESIEHSIQRVRAIAMVHEFLSRHQDAATVDVAQVLARLVPLVVTGSRRSDQRVEVTVDACPLKQSAKRTTAVALIVNELVSNAVQHGLNHGRGGVVKVEMKEEGGSISLQVADNGSGLPEGFEAHLHGHVGLEIARVLAERDLRGTIAFERPRGRARGTVAWVRFPR
ncbi:MAG TPA: GAF domain-containing protein [Armatimonadota bacterium]|nr:GAF domain-containing protein [Armatimonadota bacterium]